MWCLLKAAHKEHDQFIGLQKITLQPGQFIFGRKKAAFELGISESTVWRLINALKTNNSLNIKTNNKFSLITVVNWGFYQGDEQQTDSKMDNRWTTDGQQMDTNKNVKNDKNEKEYIPPIIPQRDDVAPAEKPEGGEQIRTGKGNRHEYTKDFEKFWSVYPRTADKFNAFKQFKLRLKEGVTLEKIMTATQNYVAEIRRRSTPEDRILHAKTFLGQAERYKEYIKEADLIGEGTGDNTKVQSGPAKPNWDNFYKR